jgi:hypothetical protein
MSTQLATPAAAFMPPVEVFTELIATIETKRSGLLTRAMNLVINSIETKQIAWDLINGIAELKKSIVEDFKESKSAAAKAHKAICAQESAHLEKLIEPDAIVREKLGAYEAEQRVLQAEAARIARENAEAEQRRLQAIADQQAAELQAQAQRDADEVRLNEAIAAEAAGLDDVAAAILEAPAPAVPVFVAPVVSISPRVVPNMATVKVEGQGSMVETWEFEIVNAAAIPEEYKTINEKAIGKVVTALKGNANIPGVRTFSRWVPRASSRRVN